MNSTVATSAAPIGSPGWPDFACSTASMASARMALAMRSCWVRGIGVLSSEKSGAGAAARDEGGGVMGPAEAEDTAGKVRRLISM